MRPRWTLTYAAAVTAALALLLIPTRSSLFIGDGEWFVTMAREGNPAEMHYGDPTHFLQVPLVRGLWLGLTGLGFPIPLEGLFLGVCFAGMVAASIFLGLIARMLLQSDAAAWIAALLFGTSLYAWTQWNGELYALGLGLVCAAVYLALGGRVLFAALLWALSVLTHSDFVLVASVLVAAVWMGRQPRGTRDAIRSALILLALAGTATVLLLLAGSWLIGSWHDGPTFAEWFQRSLFDRTKEVPAQPEIVRAAKGLLTAYSVGGHVWGDILTGRAAYGHPLFLSAAVAGFLVLAAAGLLVAASATRRRLFAVGLLWVLPVHVLLNWWFVPAAEKYHGPAVPGFVLLVTGGLLAVGANLRPAPRHALYAAYIALCAGLNLVGAVLPMRALGADTAAAEQAFRQLARQEPSPMVFVSCDNPKTLARAGVPFLRVRAIWTAPPPQVEASILEWVAPRVRSGARLYVLDRWCRPEEWEPSPWSREPFDLFFLERQYDIVPAGPTRVPVAHNPQTNPFSWRQGAVFRLVPRAEAPRALP